MPTMGLAFTKQALHSSLTNNFEEQLLEENVFQQRAAQTEDYQEGVAAFLEKRAGLFKGK
jgi:2-(1,2-epoxy-1,2-dihydrophenyl)acetyl-CoA isomerase